MNIVSAFWIAAVIALTSAAAHAQAPAAPPALKVGFVAKNPGKTAGFDFPPLAVKRNVHGLAVLRCRSTDLKGSPSCDTVVDGPLLPEDTTKTYGFGQRAKTHVEQSYFLGYPDRTPAPLGAVSDVTLEMQAGGFKGITSNGLTTEPDYRVLPTSVQIFQEYPAEALRDAKEAVVLTMCRLRDEQGHVTCNEPLYASVPGMGFEAAAKKLMESHAIVSQYYKFYVNADGSKGRLAAPLIIGELRQAFVRFRLPDGLEKTQP